MDALVFKNWVYLTAKGGSRQLKATMKFEELTEGLSVKEALEAFLDGCGRKDTLFAPKNWRAARLEKLRRLLTEPVTNDQAEALRGAVLKQHQLDTVIRWLEWRPACRWESFLNAWNTVGLNERVMEMEYSSAWRTSP